MEHNTTFPIKKSELDVLRDEASSYLKSVQWEQGQRAKNKDKDAKDDSILFYLSRAKNGGSSLEVTSVSEHSDSDIIDFCNEKKFELEDIFVFRVEGCKYYVVAAGIKVDENTKDLFET